MSQWRLYPGSLARKVCINLGVNCILISQNKTGFKIGTKSLETSRLSVERNSGVTVYWNRSPSSNSINIMYSELSLIFKARRKRLPNRRHELPKWLIIINIKLFSFCLIFLMKYKLFTVKFVVQVFWWSVQSIFLDISEILLTSYQVKSLSGSCG